MKFVHTADWQLGARFAQFGEQAALLRKARTETLARTLSMAEEREVDAFLIAGDLFEDNLVGNELVDEVIGILGSFTSFPIILLPGNHDPYTGPGSVWERSQFQKLPAHLHLFTEPGVKELASAYFLGSPLQQKVSTRDPSVCLKSLAEGLPQTAIKIGITHGSLAIPGKHQENDFPIALTAASRAGLDYLAVGHWHQWQVHDEGRLIMPGTPEPDNFGQDEGGNVALVEITEPGAVPRVEKVAVGQLSWTRFDFDFFNVAEARNTVLEGARSMAGGLEHAIVRVVLRGSTDSTGHDQVLRWLEQELSTAKVYQCRDESRLILSDQELESIGQEHPMIGQLMRDFDSLERLVGEGDAASEPGDLNLTLNRAALQSLADEIKIPVSELKTEHVQRARESVIHRLRELKG